MKAVEIKTYLFSELSKDAQQFAIEKRQKQNWQNSDFYYWAVDNCYLFALDGIDEIVIKNNRKGIYYSVECYWYLKFSEGVEIENEELFKNYFGIPENHNFYLHDSAYKQYDSTKLILLDEEGEEYENEEIEEKWNDFVNSVLSRIEAELDYCNSEEYAKEELENSDDYFTEDGNEFYY